MRAPCCCPAAIRWWFLERPLSLTFLILSGMLLAFIILPNVRKVVRCVSGMMSDGRLRPVTRHASVGKYCRRVMRRREFLKLAGTTVTAGSHRVSAQAQTWPDKPVKLILPYAPGGSTDLIARPWAER